MRKQIEMEGEQTVGQNQKNTQEPDMNQLRKVRREKLAELQQNGRDPFQITKFNQTHHSLEVKDLYEAHEAEILKDHQQPNVEGMDEEQAKEALKNDYEERRSIMDASPIHVAIAGRMMFRTKRPRWPWRTLCRTGLIGRPIWQTTRSICSMAWAKTKRAGASRE